MPRSGRYPCLGMCSIAQFLQSALPRSASSRGLASRASGFHSEIVARRNAEIVDHDFLKSFIADGLARVVGFVALGEVGPALRNYLGA